MHLTRFTSRQFAGLRKISLDFVPGLNVIVGANETGKSTVVNAIYSVLFSSSNLKKSRSEDKEFLSQYMPQPAGDFIDGTVNLNSHGLEYSLHKRWGNLPGSSLVKPDGTMISIETDIEQELKTIFELGPKTYQNIVFAPQSRLKAMLDQLRDRETIQSVSALLRMAVMNLDGVPIDSLRMEIDQELDALLKRWDYPNCRPQDNKVYKAGLGIVLSSYYQQENLRQEMNRVFDIEQELHNLSVQLRECENRTKVINVDLAQLEPLEEDILQRAAREPRIETLKKQSSELKAVYGQWPESESELRSQQSALDQLMQQGEQLKKEEQSCQRRKEMDTLNQTIKTVEQNRDLLEQMQQAYQTMAAITEADIKELVVLQGKIITSAASMQAGQILASIHSKSDLAVWVICDLDSETPLEGNEIKANGYLKIRLGELAEIEVKSGEFDYEQIKAEYVRAQGEFDQHLTRLGVTGLEEAQQIQKSREQIQANINSTQRVIANVLGVQAYDDLKNRHQELEGVEATRPWEFIQQDKEAMDNQMDKIRANLIALNNKIQEWQNKYGRREDLLTEIISREVELQGLEAELDKLQTLPACFSSSTEFRLHIKSLREETKQLGDEWRRLWTAHNSKERELPEESHEELHLQYESARQELAQNLARAQTFMQIKEAFADTLAAMDANSFQPLSDAFSRYLSQTTRGNYRLEGWDEPLNLDLIRRDEVRMSLKLLSSGTYDSVALALRFALLEQIFPAGDGFVVLDDCLVDLDADRRVEAVNIIKAYARQNQVIFTTCSWETASLLGGTTIELS